MNGRIMGRGSSLDQTSSLGIRGVGLLRRFIAAGAAVDVLKDPVQPDLKRAVLMGCVVMNRPQPRADALKAFFQQSNAPPHESGHHNKGDKQNPLKHIRLQNEIPMPL
ncbi:hypothetical protein [Denitrobaculum tricleocarpae]|uniref:Uncharacterized protein n=1 Tax=Denitrobaculum tricleocarpae TaxID=2591009 RepID=A0A545TUG6_9PROT|nr:hypothetical protein [Denitrobaculum tricleocarpae]TQV80865.1 hypothetical protein FKG95_12005 [Denitrobaculum tricleocarpae]